MHIDRKTLHLVIPFEREGGAKVYVHSTPISRECFDRFFKIIATCFGETMNGAMRPVANRVGMRMLRECARDLGAEEDVQAGLIEEIRRLTNVTALGPEGWQTLPLAQAAAAGLLDEEEADEVENNVAFFTCFWHMTKRSERAALLGGLARAWGVQISSLDSTEHASSLPMSTAPAPSGPKAPPASIPV